MPKVRLDVLLVERGLAESRAKAQPDHRPDPLRVAFGPAQPHAQPRSRADIGVKLGLGAVLGDDQVGAAVFVEVGCGRAALLSIHFNA